MERKYMEFLRNSYNTDERGRYIRNVKYRIHGETSERYILSKEKNITFNKSEEGDLFIIGKM